MWLQHELTECIIGLASEVHREAGIQFECQVAIPVFYKGQRIGKRFRADIVVSNKVILEIRALAAIVPPYEAQQAFSG